MQNRINLQVLFFAAFSCKSNKLNEELLLSPVLLDCRKQHFSIMSSVVPHAQILNASALCVSFYGCGLVVFRFWGISLRQCSQQTHCEERAVVAGSENRKSLYS